MVGCSGTVAFTLCCSWLGS